MSWLEWIANTFSMLPGCNDDLFQRLWREKRLRFDHQDQMLDIVDEYSVHLICAALNKRETLFLGLPDNRPYRPAFLFATALIQTWLDFRYLFRRNTSRDRTILYFGSSVGIREQLHHTTISNINLAEVFRQQDVTRRNTKPVHSVRSSAAANQSYLGLPQVITIYAPADPAKVLEAYKPEWIGIDCGDAPQLVWLEPLLEAATQRNIIVIGWGQNPLSECVTQFAKHGLVFCWPVQLLREVSSIPRQEEGLESILQPRTTTLFHPIILQGAGVNTVEVSLREAGQSLVRGSSCVTGSLGKDAIQLHWRYLRSLEILSVPFDFYEAEASKYWGIQPFTQLQKACQSFRDACRQDYRELIFYLEEANACFEKVLDSFQTVDPPLWNALSNLCIEELPGGEARFITFTSRARKQLFLFALLARHNITEDDLKTFNVWLISLDEFRKIGKSDTTLLQTSRATTSFVLDQALHPRPLLVGLPSPTLTPKLLPILLYQSVDVLIYPYQNSALIRRAAEWITALEPNRLQMMNVLSRLTGVSEPSTSSTIEVRLNISEPVGIEVKSGKKAKITQNEPLWQPTDLLQEITRLLELETDEETNDDYLIATNYIPSSSETATIEEAWCESAIEVDFDQGWHTIFAPDEMVNVIITSQSGQHLDNRYVRSLQSGNRIVAIPGQQRQSLYDLLISRVHRHPSIELNLALIRRWQEDFAVAYRRWRQHSVRNLDELLRQIQERGSTLTSSSTLRQWLWGHILCPEDVEDLRRLAEVLAMGFVSQHYRNIHNAANRLRGLHRKLSRRLNRWLDQEAEGLAFGRSNDMIDEELGLTFEDFRNSLLILSVKSIRSVVGPFLRSSLGRWERKNDDE